MKILLINPPNSGRSIPEEEYGIESIKKIFRGEPLSLEVIAGNLDPHELLIADLKAEPDYPLDEVDFGGGGKPDLIGITGVTCEANTMLHLAKGLKQRYGSIIVIGGHHASCDPSFFYRPFIDYVAVGIGKLSFRELVAALELGAAADNIPGIAKVKGINQAVYTPRLFTYADIVDEKSPRYDLVEQHRDKYVMSGVGGKTGYVVSAFGCTHHCTFCSIPRITGGKYLTHSSEAVLRDIRLLGDIPLIRLTDANTFGDMQAAEALGQALIQAGIDKTYVADIRADTIIKYKEVIRLWKQAGLAAAVIGIEDVSAARLKSYRKHNTIDNNIQAVEILKDYGIRVIGDFIIAPDYGYEEFEAVETFVNDCNIDLALPSILTPIPGTPLYNNLKSQITVTNLDYYTFSNAVTPTKMDTKTFYETYSALLRKFLSHLT